MALIEIKGMTEDTLIKTSTESTGGSGLRPFPCDGNGWTRHTGCVLKAEIKIFESAEPNENISLTVCNGEYGADILVNLDPTKVAPGVKDPAKAAQENLETLTKLIKVLGCHTQGKLDTEKLKKAKNMCVEFIAKHKGYRNGTNGGTFHKISYIFKGGVEDITDVTGPQLPALPGHASAAPATDRDPLGELW